jgi:hypothetical protein
MLVVSNSKLSGKINRNKKEYVFEEIKLEVRE